MRRALWPLLLWSAAAGAGDMEQDDSAALALPGAPVVPASTARTTSMTLEGAETAAAQADGPELESQRLSVDARYDSALGSGWRAVAAARLDIDWADRFDTAQPIGTLKEAY
jgi:hypothetical protein